MLSEKRRLLASWTLSYEVSDAATYEVGLFGCTAAVWRHQWLTWVPVTVEPSLTGWRWKCGALTTASTIPRMIGKCCCVDSMLVVVVGLVSITDTKITYVSIWKASGVDHWRWEARTSHFWRWRRLQWSSVRNSVLTRPRSTCPEERQRASQSQTKLSPMGFVNDSVQ